MKRLLPLYRREIRTALPVSILLCCALIFLMQGIRSNLDNKAGIYHNPASYMDSSGNMDYYGNQVLFGTDVNTYSDDSVYGMIFSAGWNQKMEQIALVFLGGILLLVFLQFREQKVGRTGEFFASLPYRKKSYFWVKINSGITAYTLPLLFYGGCMAALFRQNIGWIRDRNLTAASFERILEAETLGHIAANVFFLWAGLTAFYLLAVFFQSIIRNAAFAGTVALAAAYVPALVMMCMNNLMIRYAVKTLPGYNNLSYFLWTKAFTEAETVYFDGSIRYAVMMTAIEQYGIRLLCYLLLGAAVLAAARYYFVRVDTSLSAGIVYGKIFPLLLRVSFAVCMGLVSSRIGYTSRMNLPRIAAFMAAVALLSYFLSGRVLSIGERRRKNAV